MYVFALQMPCRSQAIKLIFSKVLVDPPYPIPFQIQIIISTTPCKDSHTSSLLICFIFPIGDPSEIIPILTGLRTDNNEQ